MNAGEVMTREVKTLRADSTLREVAQAMKSENTGIIPIIDEQRKLIGVITDRDIVVRGLAEGKVEIKSRADGSRELVSPAAAIERLAG